MFYCYFWRSTDDIATNCVYLIKDSYINSAYVIANMYQK